MNWFVQTLQNDGKGIFAFRATFLSLFIALNCFILVKTAISRGLSEAPSSFIQGWSGVYKKYFSKIGWLNYAFYDYTVKMLHAREKGQ